MRFSNTLSPTPTLFFFFLFSTTTTPTPRSNPKPIIPTEAHGRTYDINYFPRDVRRNNDASSNVPIEDSFTGEQVKALPRERLVDKPEMGSPGAKNPDVFRYDPSGARSAMTANWPALQRSLAAARPSQLPGPVWERHPTGESLAVQEKLGAQGVFLGATKDRRKRGWMQSNIADA